MKRIVKYIGLDVHKIKGYETAENLERTSIKLCLPWAAPASTIDSLQKNTPAHNQVSRISSSFLISFL